MKDNFIKLLDVKTIITFAIIGAVVTLAMLGKLSADKMYDMAFIIIGFFFGTKKAESDGNATSNAVIAKATIDNMTK